MIRFHLEEDESFGDFKPERFKQIQDCLGGVGHVLDLTPLSCV